MAQSNVFVALLRGINVGGKSLVPMAELRAMFSSLGLEDVETFIQSGNVVFGSVTSDAGELAARIERALAEAFDTASAPAAFLRTPAELESIAGRNPYLSTGVEPSKLHVVFLDRAPTASASAKLDPERSPPDELTLDGRELYLHLPNGAGRTKLTLDYLERVLGVRGTQRNWNTVLKLLELSRT
jgi:uncharacterized protein (DUF1697 family)